MERFTPGQRVRLTHPLTEGDKRIAKWEDDFILNYIDGSTGYAVCVRVEDIGYGPSWIFHPESLTPVAEIKQ